MTADGRADCKVRHGNDSVEASASGGGRGTQRDTHVVSRSSADGPIMGSNVERYDGDGPTLNRHIWVTARTLVAEGLLAHDGCAYTSYMTRGIFSLSLWYIRKQAC